MPYRRQPKAKWEVPHEHRIFAAEELGGTGEGIREADGQIRYSGRRYRFASEDPVRKKGTGYLFKPVSVRNAGKHRKTGGLAEDRGDGNPWTGSGKPSCQRIFYRACHGLQPGRVPADTQQGDTGGKPGERFTGG